MNSSSDLEFPQMVLTLHLSIDPTRESLESSPTMPPTFSQAHAMHLGDLLHFLNLGAALLLLLLKRLRTDILTC